MSWLWLLGALVMGGALLLAATVADARRRRQQEREASEVPLRDHAAVDAHVPEYVAQSEIDALPPVAGTAGGARGRRFPFGLAHPDLAPAGGTAVLEDARVLVVEGAVTSMRQLIHLLGNEPLLIVAGDVDEEVGRTLAANARMLRMPVLACAASPGDLLELAEAVGAEILTGDDLRAGYVPEAFLGRAGRVAADRRHTWVSPPTMPRP